MKPVRGIITNPMFPNGVPRIDGEPLTVELTRGTDAQPGPLGRPEHPTALGVPCVRDVIDGRTLLVEDLAPGSQLRVIVPPTDAEGRELLDAVVNEGLPLDGSPLPGGTAPH
jgi:hypothetical protein